MIVINARFLTQKITGVQRFAIEISKRLKTLMGKDIMFVTPENILHKELQNILSATVVGGKTGYIWEQLVLPHFLGSFKNPVLLNLANTAPIFYKNKLSTIHDIAYEKFPQTFSWKFRTTYKFLIPKIINSSKHIFTVSEFSKKELIKLYGIHEEKITVIYGATGQQFKPIRKKADAKYILAVSSVNYQKNLQNLVKAFNLLERNDVKLYLVGNINKNFSKLNIFSEIANNKHIKFLGHVNDEKLAELYSNALFFVFPSLYEGFGLPPLEAQACGCPVLASNTASLPEVLKDTALFCNPESPVDIKEKMELLINNRTLKEKLKQKGFENIKRFSWEQSAKKILNALEGLNG